MFGLWPGRLSFHRQRAVKTCCCLPGAPNIGWAPGGGGIGSLVLVPKELLEVRMEMKSMNFIAV